MPKLRPETERQRAQNLIKPLLKANLNQSEVARQRGVAPTTICEQVHRKPVQDALARYLDSKKTAKKVAKRLDEGLDSTKVVGYLHQYKKDGEGKVEEAKPDEVVSNEFLDVPDMHARHKYLTTYMQATGKIKQNGNGKGTTLTNVLINIGNQSGLFSQGETEALSPDRG